MATSRDTVPSIGNIALAHLDAKLESLPAEMKVAKDDQHPVDLELRSIDQRIWKDLLATLQAIETHSLSFRFTSDYHFHSSLSSLLHLSHDPSQPPLCRLLTNLTLALYHSVTPSSFTRHEPLPWYDNFHAATKAWMEIPEGEKPTGELLANVGMMMRRVRRQIVLGEAERGEFEMRRAAWWGKREGEKMRRIAEALAEEEAAAAKEAAGEKLAGEIAAAKKLAEEVAAAEKAEVAAAEEAARETLPSEAVEGQVVEIAALKKENRRESGLSTSTVQSSLFDSVKVTPSDFLSESSSVVGAVEDFDVVNEGEEAKEAEDGEEKKKEEEVKKEETVEQTVEEPELEEEPEPEPELSEEQKWCVESIDMVIGMLKLSVDGPVYEDGDRI